MRVTVYALYSTRDGEVRYVGQTTQQLRLRLAQHRNYAKSRPSAVHKWMLREQNEGHTVEIKVLLDYATLHTDEISIIEFFKKRGLRLLNLTEGGEGTVGWRGNKGNKRPDLAARNRANAGKPGHPMSEDNKKKIIASLRGKKRPDLVERNKKLPWLGKKHSEATKMKQRAAHLGRSFSEEHRRKISERRKGTKWTDAQRIGRMAYLEARKREQTDPKI